MTGVLLNKPYKMFAIVGIISLAVALIYYFFFPEMYFDISIKNYFSISSYYMWMLFAAYVFLLSGIYFVAHKGKLRTKKWLVVTHFIFVVFFLLLFFVFSSFNTAYVQNLISGKPFLIVMVVYGSIFLVDIITFIIGIILLVANLISFKKIKK